MASAADTIHHYATAATTRSSNASAGTLKATGGRSASTDGVLTAGAAEQQSIYTAFGGGESSFLTQYRVP